MTGFHFDGKAALERARKSPPLPNRPNRPNREADQTHGLGRLGRLGTLRPVKITKAEARELFEERAAIREFEGGQTRPEAERAALTEVAEQCGMAAAELRAWRWTGREGDGKYG